MAHIRRHPVSGRWQVRYRDPDGKEKSQVCDTKADADRFAATITADVVRGDYIDPRQGKVTVAEFAERWQTTRTHLAQATRDQDRYLLSRYILPAFGRREVASLRPSEIETWLARLEVAPATKAKALQKLSPILRLAVGDGAIKVNPCDGIRRPSQKPKREGRALTEAEVAAVIEAAEKVDERTAAVVWLMARAGLRIGEVLALRRNDLGDGVLHVRGSMSRKEGLRSVKGRDGARSIPISPDLEARLRGHLVAQRVASLDGWLFTAPRGGQVRYDNWRTRTWRRVIEAADVGDVNPHDLRHTLATRLFLVDSWTVPQVQAYLGHADPAVTLRVYTHVSAEGLPRPSNGQFADSWGR